MTRRSWKNLAAVLATIGALTWAVSAAAQTGQWRCGWRNGDQPPARYRVTEQQARKIDEILAKYDSKLAPIEDKLASKRIDLDAALSRSDAPESQVTALRQEIGDLEAQLDRLQAEANAAAAQVLSSSQRAYFGDTFVFYEQGYGWSCPWDCSWDAGPTGRSQHPTYARDTWAHRSGWNHCCW